MQMLNNNSCGHLLIQSTDIEVDENGTLDLSMNKNRNRDKVTTHSSLGTTPESPPSYLNSILITPQYYQALCEQEGWVSPVNYSKAQIEKEEDKEVTKKYFSLVIYVVCNKLLLRGALMLNVNFVVEPFAVCCE